MSLLWMDGFDAYGVTPTYQSDGLSVTDQSTGLMLASAGYIYATYVGLSTNTRGGTGMSLGLVTDAYQGYLEKAFSTKSELIVGFAIKACMNTTTRLVRFKYDDLMGNRKLSASVWADGVGGISAGLLADDVISNNVGQVAEVWGSSPSNVWYPDIWHYVEVHYKPHHTNGTLTVRLDGVTVLNISGSKTCALYCPSDAINIVSWRASSFTIFDPTGYYLDDIYICDTLGSTFNTFLGDVSVYSLLPTSDAGPNDMSQQGGGVGHYTSVDNVPPDASAYVYSNNSGDRELYGLAELPANILDVMAVSVHARVKKDAPGSSSIKLVAKLGANETVSSAISIPSVYTTRHMFLESAPDGGAWNRTKATSLLAGVEIV